MHSSPRSTNNWSQTHFHIFTKLTQGTMCPIYNNDKEMEDAQHVQNRHMGQDPETEQMLAFSERPEERKNFPRSSNCNCIKRQSKVNYREGKRTTLDNNCCLSSSSSSSPFYFYSISTYKICTAHLGPPTALYSQLTHNKLRKFPTSRPTVIIIFPQSAAAKPNPRHTFSHRQPRFVPALCCCWLVGGWLVDWLVKW